MTLKELQRWILKTKEEDSWWVALDGAVEDNVMSLPDISKFKEQHPQQQVSILHVSKGNDESAEWIIFERLDLKKIKMATSQTGAQFRIGPKSNKPSPEPAEHDDPAIVHMHDHPAMAESAEVIELRQEVDALKSELNALKTTFASFKDMHDELKEPIVEAQKLLEERERFLEIGENALFDKAQKQEVMQTELEQLREELNKRERYLDNQEESFQSNHKVAG